MDRDTISSPSVHVPPTCWLSIPGPSDHDVTSLFASASPSLSFQKAASQMLIKIHPQSLTVESAEAVINVLLSGLHPQAV